MKLSETYLAKTEPLLRDALQNANQDEILRCIMLLGAEEAEAKVVALSPDKFPSRQAYRRALIAQRQELLQAQIGDTLKALQALSLTPRGGEISYLVVVEGTPYQIWRALALPNVRYASLDRVIRLKSPHVSHQWPVISGQSPRTTVTSDQ